MNSISKYQQIQEYIRKRIQTQKYPSGSYLPSENEFCAQFRTTRTTVRKALDELVKQGFIAKKHGKGSMVLERGKSLGLISIKGFSGSTDHEVTTKITLGPRICMWNPNIKFPLSENERKSRCVYFQRVRYIDDQPIVLENNWYALNYLEPIKAEEFIEGSFFKTLSQDYLIEIIGIEQELSAVPATPEIAKNLKLKVGDPVLHISVKFRTSKPDLNLYGDLYCNTSNFPVRSSYSP